MLGHRDSYKLPAPGSPIEAHGRLARGLHRSRPASRGYDSCSTHRRRSRMYYGYSLGGVLLLIVLILFLTGRL